MAATLCRFGLKEGETTYVLIEPFGSEQRILDRRDCLSASYILFRSLRLIQILMNENENE